MKTKVYDEYLSNILTGNLKRTSLFAYFLGCFFISALSLMFWSLLPLKSLATSSDAVIFIFPILGLGTFLIVTQLINSNKINKLYCTDDVVMIISQATPLLDIMPIKKETFITTKCLEVVFIQINIMIFSVVGLLLFADNPAVDGIRGFINILTILIVLTFTYNNVSHFKAVRELVVSPKKEKSKFSSVIGFVIMWVSFSLLTSVTFSDFLSNIFPNLFGVLSSFITNFFLFRFAGNFYIGLALMTITAICVVYFNYFYIVKRENQKLNTVSSWREL